MSEIEDPRLALQVRASMRAHDGAAPRAVDLPDILGAAQAKPDARFSWAPLAAAAVIVAVLVGSAIALNVGKHYGDASAGERVDGNNVLLCPSTYETRLDERGPIWTPTKPNHVPAQHQLVPNETPAHAVVCSYVATRDGSPMPTAVPLTGRKILGGSLGEITGSLTAQPLGSAPNGGVCFQYATSADYMNYLIGLTYESGTLWVSAPGDHCRGASNGTFATPVNLRAYAEAAYDAGHWVSDPP